MISLANQVRYRAKHVRNRYVSRSISGLSYKDEYQRSISNPNEFWAEAAQAIQWYKPFNRVLDTSHSPLHKWFTGGEMNTCYNALDYHVENGRGDTVALYYDSPLTDTKRQLSYEKLQHQVSAFASGLQKIGVGRGDRVVIYMPPIPEAVVAMLGCARLGAIHSVVFGGFAANELAARIEDAQPKVIIASSCGIEPKGVIDYEPMLNGAIEISSWKPEKCIIFQREMKKFNLKKGRDLDYQDVMSSASTLDCVPVLATDPLYILYTSGTTGKPKGVVRDNGGHAVALKWSMSHIMNNHAGDTFWAASDIGWVVGHSYIVYGPLIQGCASVLYEGKPVGTPDAGVYWRIVNEYNVKTLFTAPTALRAIRREDTDGTHLKKWRSNVQESLQAIFVAGERGDPQTLSYFADELDIPVIDHWWQTETGWPICSQCLGMNQDHHTGEFPGIKYGSVSRPIPGYDVQLKKVELTQDDLHNQHLDRDHEIVIRLPLPPGTLATLYNNEKEFHNKYLSKFPGYYLTGDTGHIDDDGYVYVMSRTDDVINVAGHRLCTGAIEEVVLSVPEIAECAVFGAHDNLKGQVPVALLVLKHGIQKDIEKVQKDVIDAVKRQMGNFIYLRDAAVVTALPKTRSGKVVRATIQAIADSRPYRVPATIENISVLDDITSVLKGIGYANNDTRFA